MVALRKTVVSELLIPGAHMIFENHRSHELVKCNATAISRSLPANNSCFPLAIQPYQPGHREFRVAGPSLAAFSTGVIRIPSSTATAYPGELKRDHIESMNLTFESMRPLNLLGTDAYVGTRTIREIVVLI